MHPENCHLYGDVWPSSGRIETTALETLPVDLEHFYDSEAAQLSVLNHALAIADVGIIASALGLVARVRGMSGLAAATGMKRQQLYRALSEDGNPTLETLTRVITALGFRLSAERARPDAGGPA